MPAPSSVLELVERFQRDITAYKSPSYNETQTRQEFIDPLFEALGWDIGNRGGAAAAFREVVLEYSMKIGAATKAPDYLFQLGGTPRFFVEAKKPSVNIKDDASPAFQLRRYAWSATLPLSVLTDFEEFVVYDCRVEPNKTDKSSFARMFYVPYTEYDAKWDSIAELFSREAVLGGSLEKFAQEQKAPKGATPVDVAFLHEIEGWRDLLAKNIAIWNPELTQRELNYSVQMTIDRIIFLRICEDRGIEPYGKLQRLLKGGQLYKELVAQFRDADDRYNSGLFHFATEKGREEPDNVTPSLYIDDEPLKKIMRGLYYPDSPYEFSVLPVEILGNVYEQFLGKVIHLTKKHDAFVVEKPEVRKAGGVYYTPSYIVDYIVKNTVGKLLEGNTPREAAKLRIVDPACGSGSFLLGAYQYLLDWHLAQYLTAGPSKHKKELYQGPRGEWKLTSAARKRILLDNIYGVDIDAQAVEVTKLSLSLKVLEGESEQTVGTTRSMFNERALPDLSNNIKCGNSLVGPDFYDQQQTEFLDEEEQYRINVFEWKTEFSEIMKSGGFDAVIGNPPYVFGRDWKALDISDDVKSYLGKTYRSSPYQLDMFSIFMEKATLLCRIGGYIGQIVPNVWLTNMYSSSTRAFTLSRATELCITVPPPKVFLGLTVDTVVYTLQKSDRPSKTFCIKAMRSDGVVDVATYNIEDYLDGSRPISASTSSASTALVFRLKASNTELRMYADITRGVHPYRVGGYGQSAFAEGPQTSRDVEARPYHSAAGGEGYRGFIYGRDLRRFTPPAPTDFVKYGSWLAEPRRPEFFENERVYSRKILGDRLVVTLETTNTVADQQVYITLPKNNTIRAAYLTGILGSRLIAFFIKTFYDETNDAFPQIKVGQLQSLPIPVIDDENKKTRHDQMVGLVERMLDLHKRAAAAKTAQERTVLQRQIEGTDRQIDNLVYDLYGLLPEEREIVEAATK